MTSSAILDEIDHVLAPQDGLAPEELDWLLSYDIQYRMGHDVEGEDNAWAQARHTDEC